MRSVWICVHGLMTTCVIIFRGGPRGFKILEVIQYLMSPFHSLTPPRFDRIMLGRLNPSARHYLPRLSRRCFTAESSVVESGKTQQPITVKLADLVMKDMYCMSMHFQKCPSYQTKLELHLAPIRQRKVIS